MDMAIDGGTEMEILTAIATRGGNEDDYREMVRQIILQTQTARHRRHPPGQGLPFTRILGLITVVAGLLAFYIGVWIFGTIAVIIGVLLLIGVNPSEEL